MKAFLSHAIVATLTITLILLACVLSGCSDNGDIVFPGPDKISYPFPETADQLMANLAAAYGARDLAGYELVLHEGFRFVLHEDVVRGGQPEFWDRTEELRIAANMFGGEDHVTPGKVVPAIADITFKRCDALGDWTPVEIAGGGQALRRTYYLHVEICRRDGVVFLIEGPNTFEVAIGEMVLPDGETRSGYQLLRWVDRS